MRRTIFLLVFVLFLVPVFARTPKHSSYRPYAKSPAISNSSRASSYGAIQSAKGSIKHNAKAGNQFKKTRP